jgi:hypothetical protein
MNISKDKMSSEEAETICLQELATPRLRGAADPKKHPYARAYKFLEGEARTNIAKSGAARLHQAFMNNERIDTLLFLICTGFTSDHDWSAVKTFLEAKLEISSDVSFFRETAISLLEIADNEINDRTTTLPIAEAALVIVTEFGLMMANQQGKSALDAKGASHVVEYISTSLLARSNVNSTAMRISLVHFLASCEPNTKSTLQLNRVISRFGHSLLEEMLKAFFDDKRKITAAFFFLVEHLTSFFAASPKLAEMSHEVLKHYMLKYPTEFPLFLASYSASLPSDLNALSLATKHIALLHRAAIDVYQRPLAEAIGRVLVKHLGHFGETREILHEQIEMVLNILRSAPAMRGNRAMLAQDFVSSVQALTGDPRAIQKVVSLSRAKKGRDNQIKTARIGERPTPLEAMISLAS